MKTFLTSFFTLIGGLALAAIVALASSAFCGWWVWMIYEYAIMPIGGLFTIMPAIHWTVFWLLACVWLVIRAGSSKEKHSIKDKEFWKKFVTINITRLVTVGAMYLVYMLTFIW